MSNATVDKAAGQAKEVLGKVTGDTKLKNEGKLEPAGASIRKLPAHRLRHRSALVQTR